MKLTRLDREQLEELLSFIDHASRCNLCAIEASEDSPVCRRYEKRWRKAVKHLRELVQKGKAN